MRLTNYDFHLSEDLLQETFFQAYLSIARYRGESSITTWLFSIAAHQYSSFLRKRRDIPLQDDLPSEACFTDDVANNELFEKATEAIGSLPLKNAAIFIMRIFDEMSYAEIAHKLGISESSARVIFHRTRQNLKKILREIYGYELSL